MLAGERVPTRRTAPPVPRTAAGEVPQRLEKRGAALDNVHGHCHLGRVSTSYGGSGPPTPPSRHQHGLGTESAQPTAGRTTGHVAPAGLSSGSTRIAPTAKPPPR